MSAPSASYKYWASLKRTNVDCFPSSAPVLQQRGEDASWARNGVIIERMNFDIRETSVQVLGWHSLAWRTQSLGNLSDFSQVL